MARTRKKGVYIDTESTYGTDPSGDGSGYLWIPALELGELVNGKEQLETNYFTTRNWATKAIAGRDGWSFDVTVPLIGLATAAGDGTLAASVDWLDAILTHIFGATAATTGEGVDTSGTNTIDLDTAGQFDSQDPIPVFEASVPSATPRTQWVIATDDGDGGSPTIEQIATAPDWESAPTGAAVAYGSKAYTFDDDGGASVAFAYVDDEITYELLGGRCTACSIVSEVGQIVRMSLSFAGDNLTEDTSGKSALPAAGSAPAISPVIGLKAPVYHGETKYPTQSVEIDFGIAAAELQTTENVNGRSDWQLISANPTIKIKPLRTNAILDLQRNVTSARLLVQLGSGVLSGGVLNTIMIHAEEATASEVTRIDDNGISRHEVTFQVSDAGEFAAAEPSRVIQMVRA